MKSGVEALRIAPRPTGSVWTEIAMSENGIAENAAPAMRKVPSRGRATAHVRRPKMARRTSAPMAIRISAAQTGPTSVPATCRKRKDPPQTAPRNRSVTRCARLTERAVVGGAAAAPRARSASPSAGTARRTWSSGSSGRPTRGRPARSRSP